MGDLEEVEYATAADLQRGVARAEEDVILPSGRRVRVRGIRRSEVLEAQRRAGDHDVAKMEAYIVAAGMVIPTMTPTQVRAWQEASAAGEINPVAARIRALSALDEQSARDAWKSD